MTEKWELFSHKADMGIRGVGSTFEQAFEQGGLALTGVITNPSELTPSTPVDIFLTSPKMDILFYDWINELIFQMSLQHLIFGRYQVKIDRPEMGPLTLRARAWGETIDPQTQQLAVQVKGATFTELKAQINTNGSYFVQCVVDV